MLTVEMLKEMEPGKIFATGVHFDQPEGLHMMGTGKKLMWVACRGEGFHDWAIYCHFPFHGEDWIKRNGDKVHGEEHIKLCVHCTDDAFKLYRH